MTLSLDTVVAHSPSVAARLVGGRVVLVPLDAPPGDHLDDLFTLNGSGQAIWEAIDGVRPVSEVVAIVAARFDVDPAAITGDVQLFVADLLDNRMLCVAKGQVAGTGVPCVENRSKAV